MAKISKLAFGLEVETQALGWYLERHPEAELLKRNFRFKGGEIDLIFEEPSKLWPGRRELVFVEVRARLPGSWEDGVQSVRSRKLARLKRAIGLFLSRYRGGASGARLDILAWDGVRWEHWPNATPLTGES